VEVLLTLTVCHIMKIRVDQELLLFFQSCLSSKHMDLNIYMPIHNLLKHLQLIS